MPHHKLNDTQTDALGALRAAAHPLSAYDVLDALRRTRPTAAAPTAYRALTRLIELGLAHRIESINAYVACCTPHPSSAPLFSICNRCGAVDEMADATLVAGLAAAAERGGFRPQKSVIELIGHCAGCQDVA